MIKDDYEICKKCNMHTFKVDKVTQLCHLCMKDGNRKPVKHDYEAARAVIKKLHAKARLDRANYPAYAQAKPRRRK